MVGWPIPSQSEGKWIKRMASYICWGWCSIEYPSGNIDDNTTIYSLRWSWIWFPMFFAAMDIGIPNWCNHLSIGAGMTESTYPARPRCQYQWHWAMITDEQICYSSIILLTSIPINSWLSHDDSQSIMTLIASFQFFFDRRNAWVDWWGFVSQPITVEDDTDGNLIYQRIPDSGALTLICGEAPGTMEFEIF
jgi:hypothetical protein